MLWAPKPSAAVATPALASSGTRLTPIDARIEMIAMLHTSTENTLTTTAVRVEIRAEVSGIGPLVSVLPSAMCRPVRRMSRRPTKETTKAMPHVIRMLSGQPTKNFATSARNCCRWLSSTQRHTAFDGAPQTWASSSGVAWAEVTSASRTGAAIAERR